MMLVHKAYKYEIQPTAGQSKKCEQAVSTARFVYNWALGRRIEEFKATGKSCNAIEQSREITKLKATEFAWMYDVSACIPQSALCNLDQAYQNFFRRVKQGKKPGFPKFKKKGWCRDSCRFSQWIKVSHRKIRLPRIGWIRTKERTSKFKGRLLNAALSRTADRWFVSLIVEIELSDPKPADGPVVGVDVGIRHFATFSDGAVVDGPKALKRNLKRLARRQRQFSRKQKGSNNGRKAAVKVARLHLRIRNIRNDFLHKLSTLLAKTKSVIVIEDLNVSGMLKNHFLARSISDTSWSEFRRQLTYKTQWYGSELLLADRFYPSSKTCSNCGHVKDKFSLDERVYECSECGFSLDRDWNAALNLRSLATRSSRGSYACGDDVRPACAEAVVDEARIC